MACFIDQYPASVLKPDYNSTLFLKFHLLSVIKPQKIKILSCLVTPDTIKMKQIYKVEKINITPYGNFFLFHVKINF